LQDPICGVMLMFLQSYHVCSIRFYLSDKMAWPWKTGILSGRQGMRYLYNNRGEEEIPAGGLACLDVEIGYRSARCLRKANNIFLWRSMLPRQTTAICRISSRVWLVECASTDWWCYIWETLLTDRLWFWIYEALAYILFKILMFSCLASQHNKKKSSNRFIWILHSFFRNRYMNYYASETYGYGYHL
jgi:hypothetical protein